MPNDQINCKHDWKVLTADNQRSPGIVRCNKCRLLLYHSNRLQLEMNRYVIGFQKWISVIAIAISIFALVVSVVAIVISNP